MTTALLLMRQCHMGSITKFGRVVTPYMATLDVDLVSSFCACVSIAVDSREHGAARSSNMIGATSRLLKNNN